MCMCGVVTVSPVSLLGLCELQIRQAVTEFGILPLGSQINHERLPHIKTLPVVWRSQDWKNYAGTCECLPPSRPAVQLGAVWCCGT